MFDEFLVLQRGKLNDVKAWEATSSLNVYNEYVM